MNGCALCTDPRAGPDDAEGIPRLTITPVYDMSHYRDLVETPRPDELFSDRLPDGEAPNEAGVHGRMGDEPSGWQLLPELEAADLFSERYDQARAQAWQEAGPPYLDITVWAHLTVTMLCLQFIKAATAADRAGDHAEGKRYDILTAKVWYAVNEGNAQAITCLKEKAGYVRLGDWWDNARQDGHRIGQWEDARDWVGGSTLQLLGQGKGAPRLHVHNLVRNLVQGEQSGRWGRLDTRYLHEHQRIAAMYARLRIQSELTSSLGIEWVQRADRNGWEIAGIGEALDVLAGHDPLDDLAGTAPAAAEERPAPAPQDQPRRAEPICLRDELKLMGYEL